MSGIIDGILGIMGLGGEDKANSQSSTPGNSGSNDTIFTPAFYGDIIKAGASLAGTYFTLQGNKEQNDAQIQLAKDKLAAEIAAANKAGGGKGGGGGGGAGAALQIAKMNNLSALYQNWGQLVEKGGEAQAQAAQATGKLGTDPIMARLGALR